MSQPLAVIDGLDEFVAALNQFDSRLGKELAQANKKVSSVYADRAKAKIPMDRATRTNPEKGILSKAVQRDIVMSIRSTTRRPTIAAVLGANVHTVFGRRYPADVLRGKQVWQEHLGNAWKPEQLYGIGPVFKDIPDEVAALWFDAVRESFGGFASE